MNSGELLAQMRHQDGGLIELYVFESGFEGWRRFVDELSSVGLGAVVATIGGGAPVEFGPHVFDGEHAMTIRLGGQVWTSTLHETNTIELQGDPRDVTTDQDLADISRLMSILHQATGKRVILVAESLEPEKLQPYLTVDS